MPFITPSSSSIKACLQTHYSLPYFQRDYKWESRHFSEMINDIQSAFIQCFDSNHARNAVASYPPYFLGSIITATDQSGKKQLIDGQQRLTSIFLLLIYLDRYVRENNIGGVVEISTLIGSTSYGTMDYSLEFSDSRKMMFDRYKNSTSKTDQVLDELEENETLDEGDKRLLDSLRSMNALLDQVVMDNISYFIDYITEKVILIDISVDTESEAHRIFVTMNDRGLRLGPIDLLKGQILSKVKDPAESRECHKKWVEHINKLREIGNEEDSLFFRSLLRGRWAETIRGKDKGAQPGDFDLIGDAYHRWFESNLEKIGLETGDDFANFARDDMAKYADLYVKIKDYEENFNDTFQWVYYNAVRKFTLQPMIIFSSVRKEDISQGDQAKKIILISKFIDLILTTRMIEGKINNYDNLRDIAFSLTRQVRDKNASELHAYVTSEWDKYFHVFPKIEELSYGKSDKSTLLYILSRIADYLENAFSLTNKVSFPVYWQRNRASKTFDIEHVLKQAFDAAVLPSDHGFADLRDYSVERNKIGALTLLPRSRNRSLQDKAYKEKLAAYVTENILTQTFCAALYENNPNIASFRSNNQHISLNAISDFGKSDIEERCALYISIAKEIWKSPA